MFIGTASNWQDNYQMRTKPANFKEQQQDMLCITFDVNDDNEPKASALYKA